MAFANSTWSDILSTTLANYRQDTADNVTNHIPLWKWLNERGNVEYEDGGYTLVEQISYSGNTNGKFFAGYETLNVAEPQVISSAEYSWKLYANSITIDGQTMRSNSGKAAILKLFEKRYENMKSQSANDLALSTFSDGTGTSGKEIGGLQLLVPDDPTTGTAGGISRASFTFWRSKLLDASVEGAATDATNVQAYMNKLALSTVRNADTVDLIVAGTNKYNFYWQSLQAIQRVTSAERAAAGFKGLSFMVPGGEATVLFDGNCNTDRMYFLNTKYLRLRIHSAANFAPTEKMSSQDQDAIVQHVIWQGNLTANNMALQGVFHE